MAFQDSVKRMSLEIAGFATEEVHTGTLEQVCLAGMLPLRSRTYFLGVGAKGLLAVVLFAHFVALLPARLTLVVLFLINLVGAYGLGFLFAGVALAFKRTEALVGLVFSLMIFLTGALVGLVSLGWIYQLFRFAFPLTWGISLMRATLTDGADLWYLWRSGWLAGLSLHSVEYLIVGLVVVAIGSWRARQRDISALLKIHLQDICDFSAGWNPTLSAERKVL